MNFSTDLLKGPFTVTASVNAAMLLAISIW